MKWAQSPPPVTLSCLPIELSRATWFLVCPVTHGMVVQVLVIIKRPLKLVITKLQQPAQG
jgi:hypothetical protein